MRRLAALALLAACGGSEADAGNVSLVLDTPNGALDPQGYTSVEIVLHEPGGDVTRTTRLDSNGNFDLDRIDPSNSVSVEATLRNASGAAVGDGRTAVSSALAGGAQITVPVRRPIAYIAGLVGVPKRGDPQDPLVNPGDHLVAAPIPEARHAPRHRLHSLIITSASSPLSW